MVNRRYARGRGHPVQWNDYHIALAHFVERRVIFRQRREHQRQTGRAGVVLKNSSIDGPEEPVPVDVRLFLLVPVSMDRWSHPAAGNASSVYPVGRDRQVLFGQLLSQRVRNCRRDVHQLDRVKKYRLPS